MSLRQRPHECRHDVDVLAGQLEAKVFAFASHDTLRFHIISKHLVRLDMIPACSRTCPMLASSKTTAV